VAWTKVDIARDEQLRKAVLFCRSLAEKSNEVHLRRDLEWIVANEGRSSVSLLVDRDVPAFAVMFRHWRSLKFSLGEIPIFARRLRWVELWAGPVIMPDAAARQSDRGVERAFLAAARCDLRRGEALSIEGVPTDSQFYDLLCRDAETRREFLVLPLGKPFSHHFARLPGSFAEYLKQLSTRSRRSIQYSRNALRRECDDDVAVTCFETVESVGRFVDDAIRISRKTYQWRLLGLGLRNREPLANALKLAAERGWLRCYLLYCKGSPVAFLVGYQHASRFYYIDVGYDPDWARYSVGSVLQWEVIEDLYRRDDTPAIFDFSTGYGRHKSRFGKEARQEANLLLLPISLSNRMIAASWRATEAFSDAAGGAFDRLGVKGPLRKALRQLRIGDERPPG
jgi:hypothetical protein